MGLTLTDDQREKLQGTQFADTKVLSLDGNQEIKDTDGSELTDNEVRSRITNYQQSTTEQRAKTDKRVADYYKRTGQTQWGDTDTQQQQQQVEEPAYKNKSETTTTDTGSVNDTNEQLDQFSVQGQIQALEREEAIKIEHLEGSLQRLSDQSDGAYGDIVNAIRSQYASRIQQMEASNEKLRNTKETIGIRQGRQRYAPVMQAGILSDEEISGAERVAKLESDLFFAMASAAQAKAADDMKAFNNAYDKIEQIKKNTGTEIANLYKAAVNQQEAFNKKQKEEREQEQQDFDNMLDLSERSAPGAVESFSQFTSAEQQAEFVSKLSEQLGIDNPLVLLGDISNAMTDANKAAVDLRNVESLINTRYSSDNRQEEKHETEIEEREGRTTLREAILDRLEKKEITLEEARNAWGRAFPLTEFEKEFASFIGDNIE